MLPTKAFILAAGLGTRMRPLTNETPKPLMQVAGRSLLARTLDHLEASGVHDVVINTHYKAEKIEAALKGRKTPHITLSYEETLLDTGGGIVKALPYFDQDFFVLSGDGLWENPPDAETLQVLAEAWDPERMDILLLLQPVETMTLTKGVGDYNLSSESRATRSKDKTGAYMFTSIRINAPRIFEDAPGGAFSYLDLMDRAEAQGRLYGLVHRGSWHHLSTPEDLEAVQAIFKLPAKGSS